MRYFLLICTLHLMTICALSQSTFVPYNKDYYQLIDRYEIKSGHLSSQIHSSFRPYKRKDIAAFTKDISQDSTIPLSARDRFNLQYLTNDNWEFAEDSTAGDSKKPILKYFYKKQNAVFHHRDKDFEIQVMPIIYSNTGREYVNGKINPDWMMLNTRGIEIRGMIAKRIGFYSMLDDNQAMFPTYVMNRIDSSKAVPEETFYKPLIGSNTKLYKHFFQGTGIDFSTARGYITFDIIKKVMNLQVGQDKNFIGNGYRSLILSDFSSPYLFAKITTKVWKFNYTLLYAQLTYNTSTANYNVFPKKYLALHHLSLNIGKHANVGFFESVVYDRADELSYYNPIIFYKSIVNQLGAKDKATIGFDMKINFARRFSAYGQLIINEFSLKNIFANNGYYGNKQAFQLGIKYIDVFNIRNLDLQLEANVVRPFVYSALDSSVTAYTNYNTPMAHPLGANFYEFLSIVRYQPIKKLNLLAKAFYTIQGLNTGGQNWGSNPSISYQSYLPNNGSLYGYSIGSGDRSKTIYVSFTASYMLKHNFFIELTQTIRNQTSATGQYNLNDTFNSIGIRWNIQPRLQEF